ncbi:MAG: hypothetical protein KC800_10415 [Candidatus Eremiobacteraeota bacterium]|nr:hypothetical protein [Candidatus Eremiobacteraeota bacterium]
MINGNLARITAGTAKTYENMAHNFSYRVAGDGAVETQSLDQFSSTAPVVENINQRSLRAFVQAEHALTQQESAPATKEAGQESLSKLAKQHLGEGWEVDSYYDFSDRSPGPERTVVQYKGPGGSQKVDIEHRGEPKIDITTTTYKDGWEIRHDLSAPTQDGAILADQFTEGAYFSRS